MDLINPEILVEFHLAKLHRAGSYKGCVVVYPEPNAAAYDMYRISPILPHETARKAANRRHRALKPNRKFPSGGKNKTLSGPKETKTPVPDAEQTKTHVPENTEPAAISDEIIDAYHTRRLDAKVAGMVKPE
ncbi:uncharacterized protein [Aegilops tauschii subsp. strangulata]|uniref:uncharacterized protein n=1 Tax=Aegilops tauschii subsp. strangulata TaxID=200361 RepID=UPI00098AA2C8|nr:uncharacterized protein LOC109732081 [Aegilops tauschii subsp. strangulata]XP_020146863.1 uncharacterized protein LOC109732081 [Aegilops tauschii subsp. strangulata]